MSEILKGMTKTLVIALGLSPTFTQASETKVYVAKSDTIKMACKKAFGTPITQIKLKKTNLKIGHGKSTPPQNVKTLTLGTVIAESDSALKFTLEFLEDPAPKDLTIKVIDSVGGSYTTTKAYYDAVQNNPQHNFITYSSGTVASGATIISFLKHSDNRGRRLASLNTKFLLHSAGRTLPDQSRITEDDFLLSDIVKNHDERTDLYFAIRDANNNLRNMYMSLSANQSITPECANTLINPAYDTIMTPLEAISAGLIDCGVGNGSVYVRQSQAITWQESCSIR